MLPFASAGCVGAKLHKPVPLITELHHVFPVYLQARVWADVDPARPQTAHNKDRINLCGNCHASVHVLLDAMLAAKTLPKAPRKLVTFAMRGLAAYHAAGGK